MALTAERLTQLLGHPVANFVVEPLGLFSSKVSRVTITMHNAANPMRYICKEPHPDRNNRIGESFGFEARFYTEVAPRLPIRVAGCLASEDSFILLEEVDYIPFSWKHGATMVHASAAMDALRTLHQANGLATATDAWIPAFADPQFRADLAGRYVESWTTNANALCRWCPEFFEVGKHLQSRVANYYAALADPAALLHGDAHLENIPLASDVGGAQRVVFFDWQGPRRGNPLFDVAYFNVMSFPADVRRANESKLLAHYLGRPPNPTEQTAYRHAIAARASAIVEMTAGWSSKQLDNPGLGWVVGRCFSAAIDHQVQDLLD